MKTVTLIIAYIITNVIVTQSIFKSEEHLILNDSVEFHIYNKKSYHKTDYRVSKELVNLITEFI